MSATPSFFVTGGTLRPDALCYVERQADLDLYEGLVRGEFCYLLTPRQMGKSSLMVRTVVRLRADGAHVAVLDLTSIGQNLTAEQWYDGLVSRLGQQLGLEDELVAFWRDHERWGPLQRWTSALEEVLLERLPGRVVLFVDEIDTVRSLPFSTDEFFAAIRECYNRRSRDPRFDRLAFGLLGVAAPSDLIRDTRLTPFNIGRRIELHDFTLAESRALAPGLGVDPPTAHTLLARILAWTGGQPYLTQRLCRATAEALHRAPRSGPPPLPSPVLVDTVCHGLFLASGARDRDDNLIFVRERILRSDADLAALLQLYATIRRGQPVADNERDPLLSVLKLSGLVRAREGQLRVRNRIYERAFDEPWIRTNMPEAEVRRQRSAFRRGVLFTVAGALALLGLAAAWLVQSLRLRPLGLRAVMADGSVLTLDAVGYGRTHHYEPGRFRTAWLPFHIGSDGSGGAKPSFDTTTPDDALVFWLTRQDTNTGVHLNFDWWSHFEILDAHGCRFFGQRRMVRHEANRTGSYDAIPILPTAPREAGFIVASGAIAAFPRREATLRLRLFHQDRSLAAEFAVPNPVSRRHLTLRPEPLPQTRRTRDLAVTLTDVEHWLASYDWHGTDIERPLLRPVWQVFGQGQTPASWRAETVLIDDTTGNAYGLHPPRPEGGLCRREPAWRLTATFYRAPEAPPAPDEGWNLDQLELPAAGVIQPMGRTATLAGTDLELRALAGPGRYELRSGGLTGMPLGDAERAAIGDGWFLIPPRRVNPTLMSPASIAAGRPFLVLRVPPSQPPVRIAFRAVRPEGQPATTEEFVHQHLRFLAVDAPPGTTLRDAQLSVNQPRQFEFIFAPPTPIRTTNRFAAPLTEPGPRQTVQPRDPATPARLLDLGAHYNATLDEDWHQQVPGNHLGRLPRGRQRLGEVEFDIRGLVQVGGTEQPAQRFPRQVSDIPVGLNCTRLHFLHGTGWTARPGAFLGQYRVRYSDGSSASIPLVFGQNLHDWWFRPEEPAPVPEAEVVWTGANPASLSLGYAVRLYKYTWTNPRPETRIESLDLISSLAESAPFVIAITAD